MTRLTLILVACLLLWAQPASAQWGSAATRTACASGCDVTDDFSDAVVVVTGLTIASGDTVVFGAGHLRAPARTIVGASTTCGTDVFTGIPDAGPGRADDSTAGAADLYALVAGASCAATDAVTVTFSGGNSSGGDFVGVLVIPGGAASLTVTGTPTIATDTDMSVTAATVTPSATNNLFFCVLSGGNGAYTADANFTEFLNTNTASVSYRIQNAAGTGRSCTVTSAANETTNIALAAFEGSAAGAGSPLDGLILGGGFIR